jgi:hypothetical protein
MTRALIAVLKSTIDAEVARLRLPRDELFDACLDLVVQHAVRTDMDLGYVLTLVEERFSIEQRKDDEESGHE